MTNKKEAKQDDTISEIMKDAQTLRAARLKKIYGAVINDSEIEDLNIDIWRNEANVRYIVLAILNYLNNKP